MKALLLAAGLGTRLRPLTFFKAKASLPLLNLPFIHYSLQYLYSNRITEVIINLHAHPDSVRQAAGDHYREIKISYSYEPEILGTAGAIRGAAEHLGEEPFVVMNSDMLMDIPLQDVYEQHLRQNADVTLVLMRGDRFARYGGLYFEESSVPELHLRFTGLDQGQGNKYHYTGLQIVNPEIIPSIAENQKSDIFLDVYPQVLQRRKICGYIYDGLWIEIGTLKEYLQTNLTVLKQPLLRHLQPSGMQETLISARCEIQE